MRRIARVCSSINRFINQSCRASGRDGRQGRRHGTGDGSHTAAQTVCLSRGTAYCNPRVINFSDVQKVHFEQRQKEQKEAFVKRVLEKENELQREDELVG